MKASEQINDGAITPAAEGTEAIQVDDSTWAYKNKLPFGVPTQTLREHVPDFDPNLNRTSQLRHSDRCHRLLSSHAKNIRVGFP
ncbi:hypothetical protein EVAR_64867_1 [Eumeta japonica]|uniref:Uncharacterized protein n=1 Tax=Eumeta variegata TaxID=151549 RepID=A0A4C1ZLI1_EUMVA|nr:hypothetical protein EVAR_64867_1 [Eumeta japonica]